MIKAKRTRRLKISYVLHYPHCAPMIPLRGKWLAAAGFNVGDYVTVAVEAKRLIITLDPASERTALAKRIKAVTGELARLKEKEASYGPGRGDDDKST